MYGILLVVGLMVLAVDILIPFLEELVGNSPGLMVTKLFVIGNAVGYILASVASNY